MSVPHVVASHYKFVPAADITYENPAPVEGRSPDHDFRLDNGSAVARMRKHLRSADEARGLVDPFLRAYDLDVALRDGTPRFHFDLDELRSSTADGADGVS